MSNTEIIEIPASPEGWSFPPCPKDGCDTRAWEADVALAPHPRGHAQAARCAGCGLVRMFLLRFVDGDDDDAARPGRAQAIFQKAMEDPSSGRLYVTADLVEWDGVIVAALQEENERCMKRWMAVAEMWRHWRGRAHDLERQVDAIQRRDTQPSRMETELVKASAQAEAAECELHVARVEIASLREQLAAA